ncbi:MAG: hypothetical protein KatS3mg030_137 [Saprospiraceae bacterium]|nr:MAG: hypothetical protein KatS3mg030_137 [Saprospiraceae bacterium]
MKALRSNLEVFIIGLLSLFFLVWAVSKCNSSKKAYMAKTAEQARLDSLARADSLAALPKATQVDKSAQALPAPPNANGSSPPTASGSSATATPDPNADLARLYVVIDKLKLRKEPGLKSEVITELPLFELVYFLNEQTDTTYEVNLGRMVVKEPYMKVRTRKGQEGWVYGAGLSYMKKKHPGTLD